MIVVVAILVGMPICVVKAPDHVMKSDGDAGIIDVTQFGGGRIEASRAIWGRNVIEN
jgi:hypothetical protein